MQRSSLRKLLWMAGFVAAVPVALALVLLAIHGIDTYRRRQETRTHDGPLALHDRFYTTALAGRLMQTLPPRDTLGPEGMRFVALPGLSPHWYALAFSAKGATVEGVAVVAEPDHRPPSYSGFKTISTLHFAMPRYAYDSMTHQIDALAH